MPKNLTDDSFSSEARLSLGKEDIRGMSLTGKLPGSRSLPVKIYSAKAIPSIGPQGSRMPWRVSLTVRLKYGGCELVPIFW
ncbi:hypothetical protein HZ326_9949 [Fusarium oxysporum f. sp. albedinis]|nr:hypothetical protein HZ326_9949 [Fusarium oxysporum f. sp. albedinis]